MTINAQPPPIKGKIVTDDGYVAHPWAQYFRTLTANTIQPSDFVIANDPISPASNKLVSYDSKGLVVSGISPTTSDIPEGTNLYYTDERVEELLFYYMYLSVGT